jgi:hypothetical protein
MNDRENSPTHRAAFTLVELLIVIAIGHTERPIVRRLCCAKTSKKSPR